MDLIILLFALALLYMIVFQPRQLYTMVRRHNPTEAELAQSKKNSLFVKILLLIIILRVLAGIIGVL